MTKKCFIIILSAWIALSGLICTTCHVFRTNDQDMITICDRDPIKVSQ